jgi:hypothetical protein
MTSVQPDLEAFARLVDSLTPWNDQAVIIGGWAHGTASVGAAGPDVGGLGLLRLGDLREAGLCVGKVQGAEVEGIEGSGPYASAFGRVSSRLARQDSIQQWPPILCSRVSS